MVDSTKVANSTKADTTIKGHVITATTTMVVPATRTSIISIKIINQIQITKWFHTIPALPEGHKVSIEIPLGIMGRIHRMHITCKMTALLTDFPMVRQSSATEELTNDSCSQIGGIGQPNCHQPNCFLCNRELHLTSFHSQLSQQESINHLLTPFKDPGKDVDFLPCSLSIINFIQQIATSMPLRALFDGGSDTTFIHEGCLPPDATPKPIQGCSFY
jgi:hypothetical protein